MSDRTNQLKILLSNEEKAKLEMIAHRRGLSVSDVIRQFIRTEHAMLQQQTIPLAFHVVVAREMPSHNTVARIVAANEVTRQTCAGLSRALTTTLHARLAYLPQPVDGSAIAREIGPAAIEVLGPGVSVGASLDPISRDTKLLAPWGLTFEGC